MTGFPSLSLRRYELPYRPILVLNGDGVSSSSNLSRRCIRYSDAGCGSFQPFLLLEAITFLHTETKFIHAKKLSSDDA
jgi:hypothetical protein